MYSGPTKTDYEAVNESNLDMLRGQLGDLAKTQLKTFTLAAV